MRVLDIRWLYAIAGFACLCIGLLVFLSWPQCTEGELPVLGSGPLWEAIKSAKMDVDVAAFGRLSFLKEQQWNESGGWRVLHSA